MLSSLMQATFFFYLHCLVTSFISLIAIYRQPETSRTLCYYIAWCYYASQYHRELYVTTSRDVITPVSNIENSMLLHCVMLLRQSVTSRTLCVTTLRDVITPVSNIESSMLLHRVMLLRQSVTSRTLCYYMAWCYYISQWHRELYVIILRDVITPVSDIENSMLVHCVMLLRQSVTSRTLCVITLRDVITPVSNIENSMGSYIGHASWACVEFSARVSVMWYVIGYFQLYTVVTVLMLMYQSMFVSKYKLYNRLKYAGS